MVRTPDNIGSRALTYTDNVPGLTSAMATIAADMYGQHMRAPI